MKPGRELDALVAEYVFGESEKMDKHVPPYSTDIAAAWKVIHYLLERNKDRSMWIRMEAGYGEDDSKGVVFQMPMTPRAELIYGYSIPHAICLAALKAVGYDLGEE